MVRPQIVEAVELSHLPAECLQGTHFNPVDMVCVLDPGATLEPYVDHTRYLKSPKKMDGRQVHILGASRALEWRHVGLVDTVC